MSLEAFALLCFASLCVWRLGIGLRKWWRSVPLSPDPWDVGVTEQMDDPASLPVCHHCFTPQEHDRWFCPTCGHAVGPYNNSMEYISVFSLGEVAFNAVHRRLRPGALMVIGCLLFGLFEYLIFAPVFWYRFWVNLRRWKAAPPDPPDESPPTGAVTG